MLRARHLNLRAVRKSKSREAHSVVQREEKVVYVLLETSDFAFIHRREVAQSRQAYLAFSGKGGLRHVLLDYLRNQLWLAQYRTGHS